MKKLLLLLNLIWIGSFAQNSKIKIDSGNTNTINIIQLDSSKSDIDLKHADSNKIGITQQGKMKNEKKSNSFQLWITNLNNLFVLLTSIIALILVFFRAKKYFKKSHTNK